MKIKISHNWLKDYLKTKVSPQEIGRMLSYCGPSVEYVNKVGNDFVYDIEVTPNRPDMMSVIGIAREANAILKSFNKKAESSSLKINSPKNKKIKDELFLEVEIKDKNLCPRFSAIILDNIKVAPSPQWMKKRLEASGVRSLNNVVDISNYVMLETGQPVHIFDYDKIRKHKMILRASKKEELIVTIDKVERKLTEGAIVIEDEDRLIDLCGIMGGFNSAISPKTKRVVVFVQAYNPLLIRKTCQGLGFWTEAATRFEKGIDPEGIIPALWRVNELLEKIAFGCLKSKLVDINNAQYKQKRVHPIKCCSAATEHSSVECSVFNRVKVSFAKIEQLTGIKISPQKIAFILKSLGFKTKIKKDGVEAVAPSWRANDINIPEDLIEEIARIYGYHNLPSTLPPTEFLEKDKKKSIEFFWSYKVKTLLKYLGFNEVYNYSFIGKKDLENFNLDKKNCLKIINPLSKDWEYMRPSLIPSILKTVADNEANFSKIKIFELSNIYIPKRAKRVRSGGKDLSLHLEKEDNKLPDEFPMLTGALANKNNKNLFFEAKGVLESLFKDMGVFDDVEFALLNSRKANLAGLRIEDVLNFQKEKTADIILGKESIGTLGILDKKIASNFGLDSELVIFDLNFLELIKKATPEKVYKPISKYPLIKMDLAFVVNENILYEDIVREMKKAGGILVKKIQLFDVYKGKQIGSGKKSLAFAIEYGANNKTLLGEEAKKNQDKIIQAIERKFNAKLRSVE